jgi:hypothetical protein
MVLTKNQEKQVKKMPLIETQVAKSRDGKYLIHKTVITHIRPMSYYQAILNDAQDVAVEDLEVLAEAVEA